ncbi:MAG: ABC transporter substrate-binding protein [Rhodopseudomonas sp.]|uniref:ABC transporter substrate-binding protein n=1 Tax=Rhodopseudomonas sp. TaxID=1078 RepID=UPI00184914B8|nr:ABC transporter substrate-binding protein [Rhodopseudomonas sp.]NVN88718.1 ABC transporter substrate-binding protein [Rhodopseudomonas sp.]
MQRRDFLGLAGMAALSVARPGHAQPNPELPLVGLLVPRKQEPANDALAALRAGLKEAGFVEGTNYSLAMRFADGDLDRLPSLARELGALKPRVIVASSTAARTVRTELPDIPLVFTSISVDPIAYGYAQSYVRPGGMITGNVTNAMGSEEGLTEKRMDYLKELVPGLTRLGMIGPKGILYKAEMIALNKVSSQLGFEVTEYPINTLDDLEGAFADGVRDAVSALYISGEPLLFNNMARVMSLVAASGKPCVGVYPEFGRAGLLMSYASDTLDGFRHAGTYVAKILRGTKPGDLPVEQASKFTLVINLKTAKALGITVSPTLLALADEVIE